MIKLHFSSQLPVSCEEAFAWHLRPGALERMIPPWEKVQQIEKTGSITNGDKVCVRSKFGIFSFQFEVEHQNFILNEQFEDIQLKGPFKSWKHTHKFEIIGPHKSKIHDCIEYQLPLSFVTSIFNKSLVQTKLENFFAYRHRTLINDLYLHSKYSQKKLKILVTGATGFVGQELIPFLTSGGHEVVCLLRKPSAMMSGVQTVLWNAESNSFSQPQLVEGCDAVVHLAGENIAAKKWSEKRKQELLDSRVLFTKKLCQSLLELQNPPKSFLSASGIGIFGNRDADDILTEDSKPGQGFLAQLAQEWEKASLPLQDAGLRVVNLRFGAIVSSGGGILKKLMTPYKFFVGGPIGSGEQMLPWISMVDVLGIILFSLSNDKVTGPVNAVSPVTLTNGQFCEILAQCLDRPNALRVPELVVQCVFGEMGKEILLSGQNARPNKVTQLGFEFLQPHLHDAISYYVQD